MQQTYPTGTRAYYYYYDRIRINTELPPAELKAMLRDDLAKEGQHLSVRKPYKKAKNSGFKSRVELFNPAAVTISTVASKLEGVGHALSYIEITRDTFCTSEQEAYSRTHDLFATLRKKFSANFIIYRPAEEKKKKNRYIRHSDGLFSDETGYYGNRQFEYVIYARRSKINGVPCIHDEWRIRGQANIKRRLRIRSLSDLASFDIQGFFDNMVQRYLVHEDINLDRLGKWINGWTGKREVTEREKTCIGVAAITLLRVAQLEAFSVAELTKYMEGLKKNFRKERGRKTAWMVKVLSLKGYGNFSKRLSDTNL